MNINVFNQFSSFMGSWNEVRVLQNYSFFPFIIVNKENHYFQGDTLTNQISMTKKGCFGT